MSSTAIQGTVALVIFGLIVLIMIGLSQSPVVVPNDSATTEVIVLDTVVGQPVVSPIVTPATSTGNNQGTTISAAGQVAPASANAIVYTVQTGDGLYRIAQTYGTTVDAILALNPEVTDPDLISPGQTLRIPAP